MHMINSLSAMSLLHTKESAMEFHTGSSARQSPMDFLLNLHLYTQLLKLQYIAKHSLSLKAVCKQELPGYDHHTIGYGHIANKLLSQCI